MNENEIKTIFQDKNFVEKVVKVNSSEEMKALLAEYKVDVSQVEAEELKEIVDKTKKSFADKNKINTVDFNNISGGITFDEGLRNFGYAVSRPTYYAGYAVGKIPIIGMVTYHAVKGAIEGFYETLTK
ncbi:MAG: hypothetical protein LBR79_05460 [Oscillospiraceae bacterium]|nr:hypothetical protein [Oscillospiraceae bacterium]